MNPNDELRCGCGKLLAKRTPTGIELKCPRCRSVVAIELGDLTAELQPVVRRRKRA